MDFSHYNRDTAFGYSEDADGEVSLTIYLGGDNVKEFSILTGGEADIVRLRQLIRGARLESDHIAGSDRKELIASKVLSDAGIENGTEPWKDTCSAFNASGDGACDEGGSLRIWLNPGEEPGEALKDTLEEAAEAVNAGRSDTGDEADQSSLHQIELIMDADGIAGQLTDDTRLRSIRLVAYSHYGYDNNYTRAHEETEHILDQMIAIAKHKAAVIKGDFEITVESIVKQGQGDRPGIVVDPEEQTFGAVYSYYVKSGELCISELNCDTPDGEVLTCPSCGESISYCKIRPQLKYIAEEGCICPHCGARIGASVLRQGLRHAEYFFRKRDLMPVYITQDDADCIGFLGDSCSEERVERYLQLAMDKKSHNCIAALLDYKKKHFDKPERDVFDDFLLDDDWDDTEDSAEENTVESLAVGSAALSEYGISGDGIKNPQGNAGAADSIDSKNNCLRPVISEDGELVFGHYGRDRAPIVWKLLSLVDGEALIITKECIDSRNYNSSYEKTTWETSSVRKWLNDDFLAGAFTDSERELMVRSFVRNPDNYFNRVNGGNDTEDTVFLLNTDEADFYFDDRFARQALAGKAALEKRAYVAGTGYTAWWLRTPGSDEVHASNVDYYGMAVNIGFLVNYTSNCIRPAMWIKMK